MSSKLKRLLAVALAVIMSFGMISTGVAAAEETTEPPVIDEAYRITPETADPSAVLKAAKEAGANALITAGTYAKGFTVDGITLYVEGEVNVQNGITLKDAVVAGYSGDRTADVLTITETNATTVNGGTLQNLTVNITGAVHNYLVNWSGGNFLVENAVLSASGNTNGCGIFVGGGTAGCKFHAVNSDVSFSNNVQGDGGSGIWANSDGNANAVFEFEGGSLKLNNNGLNGFMGTHAPFFGDTPTPTFRFTNTDVEAMGNGSPTDGGNGDGFSYGYITLNSTDGKLHTFNVSNNDKNGLDGGRGNNAALDAYGYHIIANNNGAIGLNISKLNAGTEYSSLQQCIVEANGNGSQGMYVKQPMSLVGTIITANGNGSDGVRLFASSAHFGLVGSAQVTANDNKGSGLYIYGQSLTLGEDCDLVLQGNGNSGLNVTKGLVDLSAGSVTITGNHTTAKGGGINNADTLYLPENAVVYNNHADKAGDDIYSKELKEGKSIRFYAVGSDWVLDDCGHLIDGWYVDSDQDANEDGYPERWSAHSAPIFTQVYEGFGTNVTVEIALKAAHSEYKLTVYPEDQTKYTGGSDGDEENNQFPRPIYLAKDENGNVSEASAKTFLVNGEGAYAPEDLFSVKYYNDAGEEITSDQRYGDYTARIVLHDEFVGKWITTTDGENVNFADGVLRIRYVSDFTEASDNKLTVPAGKYEEENKTQAMEQVENTGKAGVLLPEGTAIYLNGKKQYDYPDSATDGIALFFDDLLPEQAHGDNTTYTNMLKDHAKDLGYDMTGLNTMFKYLDLVDMNNADTWVSSSKGSDVFWPYPAGTDQETEFVLLHYRGLHREYRMNGESLADQVKASEIEKVTITKTDEGIWFHVPESGFSPFALVWADKEEPTQPTETTTETTKPATDPNGPDQTGETTPLFLLGALLLVSGSCLAVILTKSKKYHA